MQKQKLETMMNVDGGCHCGQIQFSAEIDLEEVEICHCTDCQTLSGSAYRTVALTDVNSFRLTKGKPTLYEKTAEDGSTRLQVFCPECGTSLYSAPPVGESGVVGIRVGAISQRDQLVPKAQYWVRSRQSWTQDLSAMKEIEKE